MSARGGARRLVLAVIDALDPAGFERAIDEERCPALGALMERGTYVADCVSSFPSITPVAAASIA
ncbi:MAG: alkaline phosphatase family protein, partial [Actinomycetota bacterium]|nr:alkaline phosphatase family protein [Actinomycetota bacterium]